VWTILTTDVFDAWFAGLRDKQGKARIEARLRRLEFGHFGDVKPIGESVSELRIHVGPGYRIYLARREMELVVLLAGGDKGTQKRDIKLALELYRRLREAI
jgi:putative addiction module killer protein